jgi:hypothetical protein
MQTITIVLTCPDNPLEEKLFDGSKVLVIDVVDPHDTEELLSKLESEIIKLRGDSVAVINLTATTTSGSTVLQGSIGENFHGVAMH